MHAALDDARGADAAPGAAEAEAGAQGGLRAAGRERGDRQHSGLPGEAADAAAPARRA